MAPSATLIGRGADRRVKLVLVGEHGVGKTGIAQLILGRELHRGTPLGSTQDIQATVGVDFACKAMQIDSKDPWPCRLHLWDTSGQERFRSLVDSHLRDLEAGDAVVVVYDVTDATSFAAVDYWVDKARELARGSPQIAILGSKLDKAVDDHRKISSEEGQRKADELGAVLFLETCGVVKDEANSNSEAEQHLFQHCIGSLLRKCRAETPPQVSPGSSMPRPVQSGQGLEGGMPSKDNMKYQSLRQTIVTHFCKSPWRAGLKCFGFA